jgi:hypothetical protein
VGLGDQIAMIEVYAPGLAEMPQVGEKIDHRVIANGGIAAARGGGGIKR